MTFKGQKRILKDKNKAFKDNDFKDKIKSRQDFQWIRPKDLYRKT